MRRLEVHLTSSKQKRKFVFGGHDTTNLNIRVRGYKYMSTLKDSCTIEIDNLTYAEVIAIISGEYYDVDIKCGYKDSGLKSIFVGGILYISNYQNSDRSNTIIILCASNLVAKYGQSRLNLSLNSGINMFSAINFVCKRAGIRNTNISSQFKKKFLQEVMTCDDTVANWLHKLTDAEQSYITNSDSITNSTMSIFDANNSVQRIIRLKNDYINLSGGYPQLDQNGLRFAVLPTLSLMCGDIVILDNSLINLPVRNKEQAMKNYGYYLDDGGQYMILEQEFSLQNRGSDFSVNLLCKSRSLISNFTGGTTNE